MLASRPLDLVIVLVIILLVLGPKRLPGLGKGLGSGMREFKDAITGKSKGDDEDGDDEDEAARPELSATPAPAQEPPVAAASQDAERS